MNHVKLLEEEKIKTVSVTCRRWPSSPTSIYAGYLYLSLVSTHNLHQFVDWSKPYSPGSRNRGWPLAPAVWRLNLNSSTLGPLGQISHVNLHTHPPVLMCDWLLSCVVTEGGNHWPVGKNDRGLRQPEVTWFWMGNRWAGGKNDRGLRQPEVTWFWMGNRGPGGKKDRGLRVEQNRGENAGAKSKVQLEHQG